MNITIEPMKIGPITNEQLKQYAEASGDHNPIHLDDDIARKAGLSGRIAHGMLSMGYLARQADRAVAAIATEARKKAHLHSIQTRFKAMTFPGDVITITAMVRAGTSQGEWLVALEAKNQKGEVTTQGEAKVLS